MVKVAAIIQVRMNSSRLPCKAMLCLSGKTILERVVEKVELSPIVDEIWIATSTEYTDDLIEQCMKNRKVNILRGNLDDVLSRFHEIVLKSCSDIVIRVTADNPFTEARLIDIGVKNLVEKNLDYVSFQNVPYGSGIEVITREALIYSAEHAQNAEEKEHVTLFMKNHPELFRIEFLDCTIPSISKPEVRVTIDTMDDYIRICKAVNMITQDNNRMVDLEDLLLALER